MKMEIKRNSKQQFSYQTKQILKNITRDKEEHYTMINVLTQVEDIRIVNICVPNLGVPQYIRQILTDTKTIKHNNSRGV